MIDKGLATTALGWHLHDERRRARTLARAGGGGNVTVPHKEVALRAADVCLEVAEVAGACNAFWGDGDTVVGDNTDVAGVLAALDGRRTLADVVESEARAAGISPEALSAECVAELRELVARGLLVAAR